MFCLHEVRWIEHGSMMLGLKGRRFRLWWSKNGHGVIDVEAKERQTNV